MLPQLECNSTRCTECKAEMVTATKSRGLETYRCPNGHSQYRYEETQSAPRAENMKLSGVQECTTQVSGGFVQTVGIHVH